MFKKISKPNVLINLLLSIILGGALFILGEIDDAPGLCLIGILVAIIFFMRAIYNTNILSKGYHLPIVSIIIGSLGVLTTTVLIIDNEIQFNSPLTLIGFTSGALLITLGLIRIKKIKQLGK